MTDPRINHGCVFLNGKIYVVGGYVNGASSDTMESFDVEQGKTWEKKASMRWIRRYFGVSVKYLINLFFQITQLILYT